MMFIIMFILNVISLMLSNLIHLWILLEINFLIFMFLIIQSKENLSSMLAPFLFIFQSISSLILIYIYNMEFSMLKSSIISWWMILSMNMKLGLFPFTWAPASLLKNMDWMLIFAYTVLQKFIPLIMIWNFSSNNYPLIMWLNFISIILSCIKAMFHTNIKCIMALSSVNNASWLSSIVILDIYWFLIYFLFYGVIMLILCIILYQWNISCMMDFIYNSFNCNKINFYILFLCLFFLISMIPPSFTFFIKFSASIKMVESKLKAIIMFFMFFSSLSIMIYLNILFKSLFLSFLSSKSILKNNKIKVIFPLFIILMIILSIWLAYMLNN